MKRILLLVSILILFNTELFAQQLPGTPEMKTPSGSQSKVDLDLIFSVFSIESEVMRAMVKHCQMYCSAETLKDFRNLEKKGTPALKEMIAQFQADFKKEFSEKELIYLSELSRSPLVKKMFLKRAQFANDKRLQEKVRSL